MQTVEVDREFGITLSTNVGKKKLPVEGLKGSYTLLEGLLVRRSWKIKMSDSEETRRSRVWLLTAFLNFETATAYCGQLNRKNDRKRENKWTHCPLEEWINRVMRVEVPGHTQFKASMAYLNSSSHTTWSVSTKKRTGTKDASANRIVIFKSWSSSFACSIWPYRFLLSSPLWSSSFPPAWQLHIHHHLFSMSSIPPLHMP